MVICQEWEVEAPCCGSITKRGPAFARSYGSAGDDENETEEEMDLWEWPDPSTHQDPHKWSYPILRVSAFVRDVVHVDAFQITDAEFEQGGVVVEIEVLLG